MSLFCRTQRKILWRMWKTEQFWGTIDFHNVFFPTRKVNGAPKQPDYKLSSIYLPFVFGRTKRFIQVWNYLRVSKWWQNFHFWVNYTFKNPSFCIILSVYIIASVCLNWKAVIWCLDRAYMWWMTLLQLRGAENSSACCFSFLFPHSFAPSFSLPLSLSFSSQSNYVWPDIWLPFLNFSNLAAVLVFTPILLSLFVQTCLIMKSLKAPT